MTKSKKDKAIFQAMSEERNKIISQFDQSQLKGESNQINERAMGADMKPSEFTEGIDFCCDKSAQANPNLEKFAETERFAKEVDIDEESLRRNEGMRKMAKVDKI